MEKNISCFYLDISRMIKKLSNDKDISTKMLLGRVKSELRNYHDSEWIERKDFFENFQEYFCYSKEEYHRFLILFVILSSYKDDILDYDVDVLNSLIETFIHNKINPYNYERYINICYSKDVLPMLLGLQYDCIFPLTFLLEAITERYTIDDLEQKSHILFTTILEKLTDNYISPFFKSNFSIFNIITTLKKKMDIINKEKKVFKNEDYNSLYLLGKLSLNDDDKEILINKIKEIEDELLTSDVDKIKRMLDLINMAQHDLIKVFTLKKNKS